MQIQKRLSFFLASIFSGTLLISGLAQAEQLNSEQVTALVSGKTVYAVHEKRDFDITSYFSSDGTVISFRNEEKYKGKWHTKSDGSHCIQFNDPYSGELKKERCMFIEKDGDTYKRIKVKGNGKRIHVISYKRFAHGNAENL